MKTYKVYSTNGWNFTMECKGITEAKNTMVQKAMELGHLPIICVKDKFRRSVSGGIWHQRIKTTNEVVSVEHVG